MNGNRQIYLGLSVIGALLVGALILMFGFEFGGGKARPSTAPPPTETIGHARGNAASHAEQEAADAPPGTVRIPIDESQLKDYVDRLPKAGTGKGPYRGPQYIPNSPEDAANAVRPIEPAESATGTARLVVEVRSLTGRVIPGAWVELNRPDANHRASTDDSGLCMFENLAAGQWVLYLGHDQLSVVILPVDLADAETRTVVVNLGPATRLRGTVTDEAGNPIANAHVRLKIPLPTNNGQSLAAGVRTNDAGQFELATRYALRGTGFQLTVMADGFKPYTASELPARSGPAGGTTNTSEFAIVLAPYSGDRVVVKAPDGATVDAGRITVFRVGGSPRESADFKQIGFSPAHPLKWPDLGDGRWLVLIETPRGHWYRTVESPADTQAASVLELVPNRPLVIDIRWADTGEVAQGAKVVISSDEFPRLDWRNEVFDDAGAYFPALPQMKLLATISSPDGRSRVQTPIDLTGARYESRLTLELPRPANE